MVVRELGELYFVSLPRLESRVPSSGVYTCGIDIERPGKILYSRYAVFSSQRSIQEV
jgi:hypothetical protein